MITIQLTWLQLFAGIGHPLLEYKKDIPYLPVGWITNIHHQLVRFGVQIILSSGWIPTKQRENDIILMDIVHKTIPRWAWEGINRCRLFLQATTLADVVTADSTFIPRQIFEVNTKLRQSKLLYPIQKRPYVEDIEQWQFLLNTISSNGHLFTPLGQWIRSPDQFFTYLWDDLQQTVYRQTSTGWIVFRQQSKNSRRYVRLRISVDSVPTDSTPVQAIESSTYLLILRQPETPRATISSIQDMYQVRRQIAETNVVGRYDSNDGFLKKIGGTVASYRLYTSVCYRRGTQRRHWN